MNKCLVSIIVPVYNTEKYLPRCLNSLIAQTYKNIEIICINDGSTDNSQKILAAFASADKRICVITQHNAGQGAARNKGLGLAGGEYVVFVDSDDVLHPQALELTIYLLQQENANVANFKFFPVEEGKINFLPLTLGGLDYIVSDVPLALGWGEEEYKISLTAGGFVYHREVIKDVFFPEGVRFEDVSFVSAVLLKRPRMVVLSEQLYGYFSRPGSSSTRPNDAGTIREYYTVVRSIADRLAMAAADDCELWKNNFLPKILHDQIYRIRHTKNKAERAAMKRIFKGELLFLYNRNLLAVKSLKWGDRLYCWLMMFLVDIDKWYCVKRYAKHIVRLRRKNKIRVGFLVRENCKWSYASVYKLFQEDSRFEPIVLIVDEKHKLCNLAKNIQFFKRYHYTVIKNKSDFVSSNIDIIFYEQPWFDLGGNFTPKKLSKYALTLYVPYSIELDNQKDIILSTAPFLNTVYKVFAFNDKVCEELASWGIENTLSAGHPRLDVFLPCVPKPSVSRWKDGDKVRIIYAPHHSFGDSFLKQACWEWCGRHILSLAHTYKNTTQWVFKPHPRFKYELSKLLGSVKAQEVFDDWADVSTICEDGDYFDLFKTADLMISDCCSFKIEWLLTGKPFISLVSHYSGAYQLKGIESYAQAYYKASSVADIDKLFYMLTQKREDPKINQRKQLSAQIPLGAGNIIYRYIKNLTNPAFP